MTYVETWKQIATLVNRSERWCRNMARRPVAPLPVYRVGGLVRLEVKDFESWLRAERDRTIARAAPLAMVA